MCEAAPAGTALGVGAWGAEGRHPRFIDSRPSRDIGIHTPPYSLVALKALLLGLLAHPTDSVFITGKRRHRDQLSPGVDPETRGHDGEFSLSVHAHQKRGCYREVGNPSLPVGLNATFDWAS